MSIESKFRNCTGLRFKMIRRVNSQKVNVNLQFLSCLLNDLLLVKKSLKHSDVISVWNILAASLTTTQKHIIDWDEANMVDSESHRRRGQVREIIWIRKTMRSLNREEESYDLSHTYDVAILHAVRLDWGSHTDNGGNSLQ